jgi:hypothetical protein
MAPQASLPNVKVKDDAGNTLIQITDEGDVGSIEIGALPANNISSNNKLYNVASELYWNGTPLGTSGNAGGWVNSISKIHTEDETKEVGIGTAGPSDKLHVKAETGQNALRIQVGSSTKLRVLSNGGTSIGSNNTSPPANGLYVSGNVLSGGVITGEQRIYAKGYLLVGASGSYVQGIKKIPGTTSSNTNTSQIIFPIGFD